jgi:mevalonate kinase
MKKNIQAQAIAPGKLILSGEHAVVYGKPALVMAVNRYVTTTVLPRAKSDITFSFPNLMTERSLTVAELMQLKERIQNRYQAFLNGQLTIKEVLEEPVELVQFALSLLLDALHIQTLAGMHVTMQTDILIGCGMGSSAAALLSVLAALMHYLQLTVEPGLFFKLAHQAENMQHGRSSGLDLQSAWHGGCLYFKEGQVIARAPSALSLYLINTGQPQTHTGECVEAVAPYFKNTRIGDDFASVTDAMDQALQSNNMNDVILAVRENHKLLNTIGVVPEKVQQLIAEIEHEGGAAKISGAGAVAGNHAGIVLIAMEDETALQKIAHRYHQTILPVQCEVRGVHVHELF